MNVNAGDGLCAVGADGTLRILSVDDGAIRSELTLGEPSASAPAVADGRLIVGTGAGPYLPGDSLICFG